MMTCTSLRMSSGKSGRRGRSVSRATKMDSVEARPSRRKKLPGIRPAAYMRSSNSTLRGKKSSPSRAVLDMPAVASNMLSPK